MKQWFAQNWDKLITLLAGAVFGYFSGTIATNSKIAALSERVSVIETKQATIYDIKAVTVDEHALELIRLSNSIGSVKSQQQLTDRFIDVHAKEIKLELDKVRSLTISELRQFMQASNLVSNVNPSEQDQADQ